MINSPELPNKLPSSPRAIASLAEVVDDFDVFLIDQWGVLHDGLSTYPGAAQSLDALKARGKQVIVLTNSSKTNAFNRTRLAERFGIRPERYDAVISSAELLRDALAAGLPSGRMHADRHIFCVADGADANLFSDTALTLVQTPEEAECVALLSIAPGEGIAEHRVWVERALACNLPMVTPSADALSVSSVGVVQGLAGIVGAYRAAGGDCINFGKPEPPIYEAAMRKACAVPPDRVLAIGDQLESDIRGARHHGFASVLVLTGAGATRIGTHDPGDACVRLGGVAFAPDMRPNYVTTSLSF